MRRVGCPISGGRPALFLAPPRPSALPRTAAADAVICRRRCLLPLKLTLSADLEGEKGTLIEIHEHHGGIIDATHAALLDRASGGRDGEAPWSRGPAAATGIRI
ncbi:MAG: hypothetical protein ABFS37_05845 [Acidobacteriota bacterium]